MNLWMTAGSALGLVAILAGIGVLSYRMAVRPAAVGRKPTAARADAHPSDTPATPATDDLALLRRLLALEAQQEQLAARFTDLQESVNRRFGRLHADKSRNGAAPDPGEDPDPSQLGFELPNPGARSAPPSGVQPRRFLVPRR